MLLSSAFWISACVPRGFCENAGSGSVGVGRGLRVCISEKFPGDASAVDYNTGF